MDHPQIEHTLTAARAAVAALLDLPTDLLTAPELLDVADNLSTLGRVLTAAERPVWARLQTAGTDVFGGGRISMILANRLRITSTEANRRLAEAADLAPRVSTTGEPLEPVFPCTAEAERDGLIGGGHVHEIRTFMHDLPDAVPYVERERAERRLADYALRMRPDEVKKCAEKMGTYLNPDGEFTDHDRARKRHFTMKPQGIDKMRGGTFCLDPEAAAYVEALFAKLAAPGMCNPEDAAPVVSGTPNPDQPITDSRTPGQRRHDAFATICRTALESSMFGTHRGLPVTVIATATIQDLQAAAGVATTGGGSLLPIKDLIRMAGEGVLPYLAVFDGHTGRNLHFGRTRRLANPDQRLALHAFDRGCTFPGCSVPGYICETHHLREWADGGATDIENLTLVCPAHHRLAGTTSQHWRTPGRQAPSTQASGRQTPGVDTPDRQAPGARLPGGDTPGRQTPGTQASGRQTPGAHTPADPQTPGRRPSGAQASGRPSTGTGCGRTQWIAPQHVDPSQQPRINTFHHPEDEVGDPAQPP